ncbi:GGDEF domain-containing protein [Aphanothece hegewaldii CCALA 016]|uniref:GGDEF domain-containing protein n=1 Tax=Aphanothece hegewaldii CCALA 016 TaxID=2107694 RepID=A0A2T1LV87_9CHRO|nr:sensor domain-containing diguanylate cyclase [Aphanothece hegewaldii]PSF35589.1 GGDEF domain-containing protein [Aphanothece hegewaldii CCALA 016]
MIQINLKKILLKPNILAILEQLQEQLKIEISICDTENNYLLGQDNSAFTYQRPIEIEGQVLCWLQSIDEKAEIIRNILNFTLQQEFEKKSLAKEILEKYEEINLFYDLSSKISTCLKVEEVVQVIYKEVKKLINVDYISVILVNSITGELETLITGRDKVTKKAADKNYLGIANYVLQSGNPEIINDVLTDQRYSPGTTQFRSLICAPLTIQNEIIGVINISHPETMTYTTSDLKLIVSLTSQIAAAIQTVQYYEQLKEYSQTLEQKVAERTLELENAKYELEKLATIDQLTQLANRRKFDEYLLYEWKRLKREKLPISLILCDVDYFKLYNDCNGHLRGDECLRKVAQVLQNTIRRPADLAVRYGGEEFAIVLSNTNGDGAIKVAQRIQMAIEDLKIFHPLSTVSQYVTISQGISSLFPTPTNYPEDLIKMADLGLYQAKNSGRNCYILNLLN